MFYLKFFKKRTTIILSLGWLFFLFTSFQGISYRHLTLPHSLSVFILEVDPQECLIFPVHAFNRAIGRKNVKEMADEHHALAAINGGFFKIKPFEGLPAGILKINHRWFGWPTKPRGAIGWSQDGKVVLFDRLLAQASLTISDKFFYLNGLNRMPQKSEKVVFTPSFSLKTLTPPNGFDVIIRQNRVFSLQEEGKSEIPSDGYVISFGSKQELAFWKSIQKGTLIYLDFQVLPQNSPSLAKEWESLPHIVGGTPLLVHEGQIITDFSSEKTLTTFLNQPHVRSAVGLLPNGHWLFVVVERQNCIINCGMTIPALAQLMANLGCYEALNLDGGGSSTMVFEGKIVNHPRGDEDEDLGLTTARAVSDAILIKAKP